MRDNPELLCCTFCVMRNGAAIRTDRLWLVTVRGRDLLACRFHRGGRSDVREDREHRRITPSLS